MHPTRLPVLKRILCLILCAVTLTGSALQISASPAERGPWDRWYTDLTKYSVTAITAERAEGDVSRAMLAAIISRCADADVSPCTARLFEDVSAGRWYSTSVVWAAQNGLMNGITGDRFFPQSGVTGDQLYYAMTKYYVLYGRGEDLLWRSSVYEDLSGLSDWAKSVSEYMNTVAKQLPSDGSSETGNDGTVKQPRSSLAAQIADYINTYQPEIDDGTIPVSSLSLDRMTAEVEARSSIELNVTVLPEEATDKSVSWTSSDPSIALVSVDGRVIGVAEGSVTVTATTVDGGCAASCVVSVLPAPGYQPGDLTRYIDPDKPMIAITFDDGPSKFTEGILDTLEKYGAVATFFEQGKNLERWSDQVKRAVELGCEVGSHTWDHPKLISISESEIVDQIERTNLKFVEILGYAPTLIRPPYGSRNPDVDAIVKRYGMSEILWSIDTLDWSVKNAEKICKTIREEAYDGAVILVHSTHDFTAEAVKTFVPELIASGYQLVTISELASMRGVALEPGHRYGSFKP